MQNQDNVSASDSAPAMTDPVFTRKIRIICSQVHTVYSTYTGKSGSERATTEGLYHRAGHTNNDNATMC